MTEYFELDYDIDWFMIGHDNTIIHLCSCGGILPNCSKKSREDLEFLAYYFAKLNSSEKNEVNKIDDFKSMAAKGLYSYDKKFPNDITNFLYEIKERPSHPLRLNDLHDEVIDILTNCPILFDPNIEDEIDVFPLIDKDQLDRLIKKGVR